ncbi:hypothetical protein [Streptomyces antibioticus]|uniref:hypothetical protein n=1 Tax=Streptomyces antibioticus TaxID=1890 RepID=UPI0033DD30E0
MAADAEVRPESWNDGLATGLGILVVLGLIMLLAPKVAGMWAMGFSLGSVIALIVAPIQGFPMLDIGFGAQAIGAWGLMALSTLVHERKQERAYRNDPFVAMQRQAMNDAVASVIGGHLIARGEAHAMLTTTPEMVGPGRAVVEPNGPLVFTVDASGRSHRIDRRFIKSVEPASYDDAPPGTLEIRFEKPILIFSISIQPLETDRERWLALVSREGTPS